MADANMDKTVFVNANEIVGGYGNVGIVIYNKTFSVNGVCVWMVPEGVNR
jgi:hypothetical protein